jgi:hypothetical protein
MSFVISILFLQYFALSCFLLFPTSGEPLNLSSFSEHKNSYIHIQDQELPNGPEHFPDWIPQIFFVISYLYDFNLQIACSIESALRKNPKAAVYVFYDDTPKPTSFWPGSQDKSPPRPPVPLHSPIFDTVEEPQNKTANISTPWTKNMNMWYLKPAHREDDPRHFSVKLLWLRLVSTYRGRLFAYRLNYTEVFSRTPLMTWYLQEFHRMKYNHLSDALRLGVLYHFGGAYFDTDWISLRSVEGLRNVLGIEAPTFPKEASNGQVNGAVMIFEKKHPFLQNCVDRLYTAWNNSKNPRDDWTIIGPRFLTGIWKLLKERNQTAGMEVLPPRAFYPVFYENTNVFESV